MTSQITPDGLRPASRARSTAASVCPVRSSTPPALAFSGKMWPGWTRSRGRAAGSIATWIVCARSCAEMPVVMPSRASTETVKAVWKARLVLRRHQVEPELVAALGRERQADQPAPVGRHEVDRLGRRELGRQREVALVLAVLGVADDDHAAGADVLDRLLDAAERGLRHAFELLHVLGQHIDLQVDRPTGRSGAERRALERLRDERDLERVVVDSRNGKGHALDRDRALLDDVAQQLGRRGDPDDPGEALLAHRVDLAGAVDVALDDVAAEPVAGAQRQLEVDRVARPERAERAAPQRLLHHVGGEAVTVGLDRRQADAVDRHRVARAELAGELAAHAQAHAAAVALERLHRPGAGHEPREHLTTPGSGR